MVLKGGRLGKGLVTEVTCVGPFSGVRSYVTSQTGTLSEPFTTLRTWDVVKMRQVAKCFEY